MSSYQTTLHGISERATSLLQLLGPVAAPSRAPQNMHRYHLSIPLPQPVTALFIARGYELFVAEKLNQAFLEKALSLKRFYEEKYRHAFNGWAEGGLLPEDDVDRFVSAAHTAYISQYDQAMAGWRAKMDELSRRRVASTRQSPPSVAETKHVVEGRTTFKNECVPLLEEAFVLNAYPSRADKEVLALETGMEYKQVNIWFQNRRARSKKEGLPLQRTATFVNQMSNCSTASPEPELESHEITDVLQERQSPYLSESTVDPFNLTARPVYAFPTSYPPLYDEGFAGRHDARSFKTPWVRVCATQSICRPQAHIDELTVQMERLVLSDGTSDSSVSSLPSFTLVLPRAPLPALVRTVTASSRAQPLTTLVSAAGSSSSSPLSKSFSTSRELHRVHPIRLSIESPETLATARSRPVPIPYSRASSESRRSQMRFPTTPYTSRSSSMSSIASSRCSSSSWSDAASSTGPLTPVSTPPCMHLELTFQKDTLPFTSPDVHPSSKVDGVRLSTPLR